MPLMHAEDVTCVRKCKEEFEIILKECEQLGNDRIDGFKGNIKFAVSHLVPIEKFGRYPTRNAVLGR